MNSPSTVAAAVPPASTADAAQIEALRDSVRTYVARQAGFTRVRAQRNQPPGFDRDAWRQMAELGWLGVLVPEEYDGLDLGLPAAVAVAERAVRESPTPLRTFRIETRRPDKSFPLPSPTFPIS